MNKVQNLVSSNQCNISCHARYLFSQVDDHDGVACDSSSRVRRGIFDPLPVVNPVDLQRRCIIGCLAFFQFLFGWKWTLGAGNPPASHSKITDSPSAAVWLSGSWNSRLSPLQSRAGCCCSFEYIWRWYLGEIWGGMDGQADGIRLCNPDSIWRLTRVVPFILIVHVLYHKCLSVIVIRGPTLR